MSSLFRFNGGHYLSLIPKEWTFQSNSEPENARGISQGLRTFASFFAFS
jgi:hypothetical protein